MTSRTVEEQLYITSVWISVCDRSTALPLTGPQKSWKLKIHIKIFWDSCDVSLLKESHTFGNKLSGSHLPSSQTRLHEARHHERRMERLRNNWRRFKGQKNNRRGRATRAKWMKTEEKTIECEELKVQQFICSSVFTLQQFACSSLPTLYYLWEKLKSAGVWKADEIGRGISAGSLPTVVTPIR